MALEQKTSHVVDGLGTLIGQFKGVPNLAALLTSYLEQLGDAEDALFQVLLDTTLDAAVGVQLDNLGTIVGVTRGGRTDDDYRTRLRAQVLVNKSSGTIPQLLEILAVLMANAVELRERFPAAFEAVVGDALPVSAAELAGILEAARPAAVNAYLEYTGVDDGLTFTLADGDAVQTSSPPLNQGFGYVQDGAWAPSTAYVVGQIVTNDAPSRDYVCVTSGTSAASGGPTGTGAGIVDGTCVWDYVADTASPVAVGGQFADALEA